MNIKQQVRDYMIAILSRENLYGGIATRVRESMTDSERSQAPMSDVRQCTDEVIESLMKTLKQPGETQ